MTSKKVIRDNEQMLVGPIDRQQLYFDYPDWKLVEREYVPSPEIIKQLRDNMVPVSVDIFLATWCGDSRRQLPAFFKIIDAAGIADKMDINLWAVDRNKKANNGLAQTANIEFVPTFVFYESNSEIGRIIETPESLLEEDMLNIIRSASE